MRISSDAIFGWASRRPRAQKPEIAVLAVLGWAHWLLLGVAGAIIVARALRVAAGGVSPHGAMNDPELSIRMILVRKSVAIYDVQVKMMCTIGGNRCHLPLARGLTSYDAHSLDKFP